MGAASAILLVLITIICESAPDQLCIGARGEVAETDSFPVPPLGVYAIAGCGMDLFVNICLTVLGYVLTPGPLVVEVTKLTAAATQLLPGTPPCLLPRVHLLRPKRAIQERHTPSHESARCL